MIDFLSSTIFIKIYAALLISLAIFGISYYIGEDFNKVDNGPYTVKIDQFDWTLSDISVLISELESRKEYMFNFYIDSSVTIINNDNSLETVANPLFDIYQSLAIHKYNSPNKWFGSQTNWILTGYRSFQNSGPVLDSYIISNNEKDRTYDMISTELELITDLNLGEGLAIPRENGTIYFSLGFSFSDGSNISFRSWGSYLRIELQHFFQYEYGYDYTTLWVDGPIHEVDGIIESQFVNVLRMFVEVATSHFPER